MDGLYGMLQLPPRLPYYKPRKGVPRSIQRRERRRYRRMRAQIRRTHPACFRLSRLDPATIYQAVCHINDQYERERDEMFKLFVSDVKDAT